MSPFRRRFLALVVGLGVGAAGLEVALRVGGLGVRGQLGIFQHAEGGDIVLAPCASDRVRGPDGVVTEVVTDRSGFRVAVTCEATQSDVVVLGDSQVFGLGVRHEDTFAARLGARNAGVPDYGVADALALGRELIEFARLRMTDIFRDNAKVHRRVFSYDAARFGMDVRPQPVESYRFAAPTEFVFALQAEQKQTVADFLAIYGTSLMGLSRILSKVYVRRLFRVATATDVKLVDRADKELLVGQAALTGLNEFS